MQPDREAQLAAHFDAHAGPVWRYVVSLTNDHAGADDVVQETLLRAWRSPHILVQDPASTRAWMFTVARRIVIDEMRASRHRRETTTENLPERSVADSTDALFDSILVADALASLTDEHRSVIVSAYFGGRSIAQVASELDIAEGTVKSRLHYGLRSLKTALLERGVTR